MEYLLRVRVGLTVPAPPEDRLLRVTSCENIEEKFKRFISHPPLELLFACEPRPMASNRWNVEREQLLQSIRAGLV